MPLEAVEDRQRSPAPTEVLDLAAERLRSGLRTTAVKDAGRNALDSLDTVVRVVKEILAEGISADALRPVSESTLDARLLMALRVSVLRLELTAEASDAALTLLRAMESLLGEVLSVDEDGLATRLAEPDALQLLIEVAHDLRAPLTSILFLSEILRTGYSGDVNDQQRSQLGLIYSAALNLASLTSNVVDLARAGKGLLDIEEEPYSLSDVIAGVRQAVQPMAEEKGIELRVVLPDHDRAYGYPAALGRVVLNLTTNALKFTDQGWVEIGIKRRAATRVEFYVQDTGRGISAERQEELYDAFKKRAYSDGHFFSGSGVGLSIARRIVRAMGSELEFATEPDAGTRFHFTVDISPPR